MAARKNSSKKSEQKKEKQLAAIKKDNRFLMLSIIAAAIIPLLVQIVSGSSGLAEFDWFSKTDNEIDFFLICKMYGIIILTAVMIIVLSAAIYKNFHIIMAQFKDNLFLFAALITYAFLALLSAIFANNAADAFKGGYAQHEPVIVLLGYCIMLAFAYIYTRNEHNIRYFLKGIMWGVAIVSFLGVLQWASSDFFTSDAGKTLVSMFSSIKASQISLSFEIGRVYMTLYNPNYVGSYVALVFPIMIAGIYIMDKMWEKVMMGIVALMLVICLIGSSSTTGMTAIVLSLILFFVVCIPLFVKYRKSLIIIACAAVAVVAVVVCVNRDKIIDAVGKYELNEDNFALDGICLHDDNVELDYKGTKLYVICNNSEDKCSLSIFDEKMSPIKTLYDETSGNIYIPDNDFYRELAFGGVTYEDDTNGFKVICNETEYLFTNDNDEHKYYYHNVYGKNTTDIIKSDSVGFDNHEQFASNRGFIWSRSIPLLKNNILLGSGPDNFIYEFPNNDYVSLLNNNYYGEVVTRPHNMYLQIGVQTGVLSLAAFLFVYIMYFAQSIKLFWKTKNVTAAYITGISIFIGSFGYMVCGIANDSNVCTAPVFWTMMGIGLACNRMIKGQINEQSKSNIHNK